MAEKMKVSFMGADLPNIFVLDDDEFAGSMICEVLNDSGFEAKHAFRVTQIPLFSDGGNPDLLLVDVHMPFQQGDQIVGNLRSIGLEDLPVIFVSSDDSDETQHRLRRISNSSFVSKRNLGALPKRVYQALGVDFND